MSQVDYKSTSPESLLKKYNNSYSSVRAHIISNRWLRNSGIPENIIEYKVIVYIAAYCKFTNFTFDNLRFKSLKRVKKRNGFEHLME